MPVLSGARLAPLLSFFFAASLSVLAQAPSPTQEALTPLTSKRFTWPNVPYQVTGSGGGIRGPQLGYNICNGTTEGPSSLCQTLFLNAPDDFCIWSSNQPEGQLDTIGDSEAREVAWCTRKGHGSRIIPWGAITGAQWLYAKNYLQVVGFIDQTKVNLRPDDMGGELDPHGADEQGNPLGGIVFTNGFTMNSGKFAQHVASNSPAPQQYTQVVEWVNFIGSGVFCLKMCNPGNPTAPQLCQHIYDRIGCTYNAIADYNKINGTYEVCDSEDMAPPGIIVENGATSTWYQGPEGVVPTPPYQPVLPASSNCHTYSAEQLFGPAPTTSTTSSSVAATMTGTSGGTTPATGSSASGASQTASSSMRRADVNLLASLVSVLVVASGMIGGAVVLL